MNGIWLHFTRFFQASCGITALDSCRVVEAMMPMMELYGVDLHELMAAEQPRVEDTR